MAITRDRFSGMDTLLGLFDTLAAETDAELRREMPQIGAAVLAAQRADVSVRTGDLWRGLSVQVLNGGMTVRVGLMGLTSRTGKTSYGSLYYGRFVEFGRKGQVVTVERRRRVLSRGKWILRSRRGRKVAEDIAAAYPLKVKSMPPRPFVDTPASQAATLDLAERLANFWSLKGL